jgi:hypothetical protein
MKATFFLRNRSYAAKALPGSAPLARRQSARQTASSIAWHAGSSRSRVPSPAATGSALDPYPRVMYPCPPANLPKKWAGRSIWRELQRFPWTRAVRVRFRTSRLHSSNITSASAPAIEAGTVRPPEGSCEAETVEVEPISPTIIRRVSVGTCQFSHLGRTGLLSIAYGNLATLEQEAEHTFTAANGDLLNATSVGTGAFTPLATVHFTGVTTISGGTGRFANATGVMAAVGTVDLATGDASLSYDGWIAH